MDKFDATLMFEKGAFCAWFEADYSGGEDLDLYMVSRPLPLDHWFDFEAGQIGLDGIMALERCQTPTGMGWIYSHTTLNFLLTHGIAPFQPFLVRFNEPGYITYPATPHSDEEFDAEFSWEVVYVSKLTLEETTQRWSEWDEYWQDYRNRAEGSMRELRRLRKEDVDAMYLKSDRYWTGGYYDEMVLPNGYSLSLCSKHTQTDFGKFTWPVLMTERRDDGDRRKAREALRDRVALDMPHVLERFDRLPIRSW